MAHRTDTTSTVRAAVIATKWDRPRTIVRKVAATSARKVGLTTMARVAIVKKAADVGARKVRPEAMGHAVMRRKVPGTCVAKDHPETTARHETATKVLAIGDQMARRVVMVLPKVTALAANTVPIRTIHRAHPMEGRTRKKATISQKLLFKSLSLAPGPASLGPSQHGTGLLQLPR